METNHTSILYDLLVQWRERARFLAEYGDPNSARLWHLASTELELALRVLDDEAR